MRDRGTGPHRSDQSPDPREAPKGFVKGEDLPDTGLEGYFRNQMVGKTCRIVPASVEGLAGQAGRFDGDASRSEQSLQGIENSLLFPPAPENP
jgi:hypothetical protein